MEDNFAFLFRMILTEGTIVSTKPAQFINKEYLSKKISKFRIPKSEIRILQAAMEYVCHPKSLGTIDQRLYLL